MFLSKMFPEPRGPGQFQHGLQELEDFLFDESVFMEVGHTTWSTEEGEQ